MQRPARDAFFRAIDFETTGSVRGFCSLPWQVGIATLAGRAAPEAAFDSLIRVPENHPFNAYAPGDHARQRAAIAQAPAQETVWLAFHPLLSGNVLVAHNIGTERTHLNRMAPLHRYGPWIDTLTLARKVYPGLGDYSLDALIARLGLLPRLLTLRPAYRAHDACSDALACALFLDHILSLPGWSALPLAQLITHEY